MRSLALGESPLLKRGWTGQPGLNQFPNGGEGHLLRMMISRYVGDGNVEHGDSRVLDARLLCGRERDWEGAQAGQE